MSNNSYQDQNNINNNNNIMDHSIKNSNNSSKRNSQEDIFNQYKLNMVRVNPIQKSIFVSFFAPPSSRTTICNLTQGSFTGRTCFST